MSADECAQNESSPLSVPFNEAGFKDTIAAIFDNQTGLLSSRFPGAAVADLFGNFSQMTLNVTYPTSVGGASVESYAVVGRPVVGSLRYYEVNFSLSGVGTYTALFAPNGTSMSVTTPYNPFENFNESFPATYGASLASQFEVILQSGGLAKSVASNPAYRVLNSSTVSLGATSVEMTYFQLQSPPQVNCEINFSNDLVGVGTLPGTNTPVVLYTDYEYATQAASEHISMALVSVTPA